jgi:SAM-dependent methyltransferase
MTEAIATEFLDQTVKYPPYENEIMGSVLDVGCGLHPRGDVNVDLYIDSRHRRGRKGPDLDLHSIQNFVQADAKDMYMFRDRQFDTVKCYHLIEHFPAPECWELLKELWRVTNRHLVVVCPHRYRLKFPYLKRSITHVSNFDAATFEKAVPKLLGTWNFEAKNLYRGMFHKIIPFPNWPHQVRLDIWRSDL